MARRSLRSIAGLLANPRRKKARKGSRKARAGRTASGRFKKGRKAPSRKRKSSRRRKGSRRRSLPPVYRNRGRKRARASAKRAAAPRRNRGKGRRFTKRRSYRRNPSLVAGVRSTIRKLPVIGKPAAQMAGYAVPVAVGGYLAPMGAFKADAWLAGQQWAQRLYTWDPRIRWFLWAGIGAIMAAKLARMVKMGSSVPAAAVAAGIFGAFYGASVGYQTPQLGALVLAGSRGRAIGALNLPGYGMAPAYQVGPAMNGMGAVVLGHDAF